MPPLTGHDAAMTDQVARRRSRKDTTGIKAHYYLAPHVRELLTNAAEASGLNRSLYLERLLLQIETDGTLPVLSPTLDGTEVRKTAAA